MPKIQKKADIFVSAVFVVDERAENPVKKVNRLADILKDKYVNYEIVVIDNGLAPKNLSNLRDLLTEKACIRVIRLSRNHDTDTAIFAGVEAAIGDYVCILYNDDPVEMLPKFILSNQKWDIVFGVATNNERNSRFENIGARFYYWYSKKYLGIDIPNGSTYYISMNRSAANAMTRSGRFMRHIRHMAVRVGFNSTVLEYELPKGYKRYSGAPPKTLINRFIDLVSNYSTHPLKLISYIGMLGGLLNLIYAVYVVIINLSVKGVAKGWTTLSIQSSIMFFLLFMILALLAEYVGKILNEVQQEPPYHVMEELSSTVSIADETRRNVTYED